MSEAIMCDLSGDGIDFQGFGDDTPHSDGPFGGSEAFVWQAAGLSLCMKLANDGGHLSQRHCCCVGGGDANLRSCRAYSVMADAHALLRAVGVVKCP
jgi:hypothetical protein